VVELQDTQQDITTFYVKFYWDMKLGGKLLCCIEWMSEVLSTVTWKCKSPIQYWNLTAKIPQKYKPDETKDVSDGC
jgi:hypothetical protein